MTHGRTPAAAISTIFRRMWFGSGRPFINTPPNWLTRPWPKIEPHSNLSSERRKEGGKEKKRRKKRKETGTRTLERVSGKTGSVHDSKVTASYCHLTQATSLVHEHSPDGTLFEHSSNTLDTCNALRRKFVSGLKWRRSLIVSDEARRLHLCGSASKRGK